ncbi:unnamed protein product, partial [Prorocentrum cordatum]
AFVQRVEAERVAAFLDRSGVEKGAARKKAAFQDRFDWSSALAEAGLGEDVHPDNLEFEAAMAAMHEADLDAVELRARAAAARAERLAKEAAEAADAAREATPATLASATPPPPPPHHPPDPPSDGGDAGGDVGDDPRVTLVVGLWCEGSLAGADVLRDRARAMISSKIGGGGLSLMRLDEDMPSGERERACVLVKWIDPSRLTGRRVRIDCSRDPPRAVWPTQGWSPLRSFAAARVIHPDVGYTVEKVKTFVNTVVQPQTMRLKRMAELALSALGGDEADTITACCLCEAEIDEPARECAMCALTFHESCGQLVAEQLAGSPHMVRPADAVGADGWLCDWADVGRGGNQLCLVRRQWLCDGEAAGRQGLS